MTDVQIKTTIVTFPDKICLAKMNLIKFQREMGRKKIVKKKNKKRNILKPMAS